jgi:hypothetical protein
MEAARHDRLAPDEIARRSGVEVEHQVARRDFLPTGVATVLAGADVGAAVGPVADNGEWVILWPRARRPPTADDPAAREAAAEELVTEALERASTGHVQVVGTL